MPENEKLGEITHYKWRMLAYDEVTMTRSRGETVDAAGEAICPESLGEALHGVPTVQRDWYLCLREAFLALDGTAETFHPVGDGWRPHLSVDLSDIVAIQFHRRGRRSMSLEIIPMPSGWLAGLGAAAELKPATRDLLQSQPSGRKAVLPVKDDAGLAEGLVVLMLMHAHLRAGLGA